MTDLDIADFLDEIVSDIRRLPSVSRAGIHAVVEAKSELTCRIARKARDLRAVPTVAAPAAIVSKIHPGTRMIGRREVAVVRRAGRP